MRTYTSHDLYHPEIEREIKIKTPRQLDTNSQSSSLLCNGLKLLSIFTKKDLLMGIWYGIESAQYLSPQLNKAAKHNSGANYMA